MKQNLINACGMPVCLFAICAATSPLCAATLPSFPGAEGFGALATGGRGGGIVHVANLEDSGPGSFRDAVSQPHRLVIFDAGGVIKLKSNVSVSSDITVFGQSAPGAGVTIYGHSLSLSGSKNIILRYLRVREGIEGDKGKCSININDGKDIILDHLSIQWGRWDCMGITKGCENITVQNCIIGQGLDPQRFGSLIDTVTNVSLSHNLWIDNQSRNPKAKGFIEYINNVVYNWGVDGLVGGHSEADHELDVIGSVFIRGPSSNERLLGMFTSTDKVFQQDNLTILGRDGTFTPRAVVEADFSEKTTGPVFVTAKFCHPEIPVTVEPPTNAFHTVIASAGCSLQRDKIDLMLIDEVTSLGTKGKIIRNENEEGGLGEIPPLNLKIAPADGIPDAWKTKHGLSLDDKNAALGDYNHDGYCNLEKYMAEIVAKDSQK
jgi:pectate lyase